MLCTDILDIKCVLVNELIGDPVLTMLILGIVYFVVAAKLRLGFDTTIAFSVPFMLVFAGVIGGFALIYLLGALIAGLIISLAILRLLGNK